MKEAYKDNRFERGYFTQHECRYGKISQILRKYLKKNYESKILELGSYNLAIGKSLVEHGFNYYHGIDLPNIVNNESFIKIAKELQIQNISYELNNSGKPIKIPYPDNYFDVILCFEMLEHITFNPVSFWQEVYRITREHSIIIIATPNGLSFMKILFHLKSLLTLSSYGARLKEVFSKPTSGHHWKEYSYTEMKNYFNFLTEDVKLLDFEYYFWRSFKKNTLLKIVYFIQERVLPLKFRSEIFAVYNVNKQNGFIAPDPDSQYFDTLN